METYTVGEKVYLKFQVENVQGDEFSVTDATYNLSAGKKSLVKGGHVDVLGDGMLKVFFEPTVPGPNVLDIWYHVKIGGVSGASLQATAMTEYRTVRFILQVVPYQ